MSSTQPKLLSPSFVLRREEVALLEKETASWEKDLRRLKTLDIINLFSGCALILINYKKNVTQSTETGCKAALYIASLKRLLLWQETVADNVCFICRGKVGTCTLWERVFQGFAAIQVGISHTLIVAVTNTIGVYPRAMLRDTTSESIETSIDGNVRIVQFPKSARDVLIYAVRFPFRFGYIYGSGRTSRCQSRSRIRNSFRHITVANVSDAIRHTSQASA